MALFFFRIRNGRYSGASDSGIELADRNAAWRELTSVCADIVSGISRKLKQNSQWEKWNSWTNPGGRFFESASWQSRWTDACG